MLPGATMFDSVFIQYKTHAMWGWRDRKTGRFSKWTIKV